MGSEQEFDTSNKNQQLITALQQQRKSSTSQRSFISNVYTQDRACMDSYRLRDHQQNALNLQNGKSDRQHKQMIETQDHELQQLQRYAYSICCVCNYNNAI